MMIFVNSAAKWHWQARMFCGLNNYSNLLLRLKYTPSYNGFSGRIYGNKLIQRVSMIESFAKLCASLPPNADRNGLQTCMVLKIRDVPFCRRFEFAPYLQLSHFTLVYLCKVIPWELQNSRDVFREINVPWVYIMLSPGTLTGGSGMLQH